MMVPKVPRVVAPIVGGLQVDPALLAPIWSLLAGEVVDLAEGESRGDLKEGLSPFRAVGTHGMQMVEMRVL